MGLFASQDTASLLRRFNSLYSEALAEALDKYKHSGGRSGVLKITGNATKDKNYEMDFVKPGVFVTIGDQQYKVLQAQKINDTLPKCTDLTLENPTVLIAFDESEAGTGGRF